jgi:arsenite-transporting ATPase
VAKSSEETVVLDTAPTGHTILLLESTENYNRQIENTSGEVTEAEKNLLPRLKNPDETEVIIVSLAETTPFYEAKRLSNDLRRAGLMVRWWVVNESYSLTETESGFLRTKAKEEVHWIQKVNEISGGNYAVIPWKPFEVRGKKLFELL